MSESVTFSSVGIGGSSMGTALTRMLVSSDIEPGSEPSYQLCKTIYLYHPLGGKMAEAPLSKAQSKSRDVTVAGHPERIAEAFMEEWAAAHIDKIIHNTAKQARIYGIASVVVGIDGENASEPIDFAKLANEKLFYNVLDPLNTAGSLVLNQDPNSSDYQKTTQVTTNGQQYHRSRCCIIMNEEPIYIAYTSSSFGFVGRSVYQRALYPLKSFIQSMATDDMITRKAGVLIAKMKPPGSIIDRAMQSMMGAKRSLLRQAETDNVLGIDIEESIESLNLNNIDGAGGFARTNILKNIATAADMPAVLLENETMVSGFGEGQEDANNIAEYIDRVREWMQPLYDFFEPVVQHRAWNKGFFQEMQKKFPETYGNMSHEAALTRWQNAFKATWPESRKEPESERVKVADVKLKAILGVVDAFVQMMDPENKGAVIEWAQSNINDTGELFSADLEIDIEALKEYEPPQPEMMGGEPGEAGQPGQQPGQPAPGPQAPKAPKPQPFAMKAA